MPDGLKESVGLRLNCHTEEWIALRLDVRADGDVTVTTASTHPP